MIESGNILSDGDVRIEVANWIESKGNISSGGKLNLTGNSLSQRGSILSNGEMLIELATNLKNSGNISSMDNMNIFSLGVENDLGLIGSNGLLNITSEELFSSGQISSLSNLNINVSNNITNAGEILTGETLNIGSKDLSNLGYIYTGKDLSLAIANKTTNSGDIEVLGEIDLKTNELLIESGNILSDGDVRIEVANWIESKGNISSGGKLNLTGNSLSQRGSILSNGEMLIELATNLKNSGNISSMDNMNIFSLGVENDLGLIGSNGLLNITSEELFSSGQISSLSNLSINVSNNITNAGEILTGETLNIGSKDLSNLGYIYTGKDLSLAITNKTTNSGDIEVLGEIDLKTNELLIESGNILSDGDVRIEVLGIMDNGGDLSSGKGISIASNGLIQRGNIISREELLLTAEEFTNSGNISSIGDILLTSAYISNSGGEIYSNEGIEINSNELYNEDGLISSLKDLQIRGYVENIRGEKEKGLLESGDNILIIGEGLKNSSLIQARGTINIESREVSNLDGGNIITYLESEEKEGMRIKADEFTNTGSLLSIDSKMGIETSKDILNQGLILSKGFTINTGEDLINEGVIQNIGEYGEIRAFGVIDNNKEILSEGSLSLMALGEGKLPAPMLFDSEEGPLFFTVKIFNESGIIQSNGSIEINSGFSNYGGEVLSKGDIIIKGEFNNEEGVVQGNNKVKSEEYIYNVNGQIISLGEININNKNNSFNNERGMVLANNSDKSKISIKSFDLINKAGEILSSGDIEIELTSEAGYTTEGKYYAGNSFSLSAESIINAVDLEMEGAIGLKSKSGDILNKEDKKIISNKGVKIESSKNLNNSGLISGYSLDFDVIGKLLNESQVLSGIGGAEIETKNLVNKNMLSSAGDMSILAGEGVSNYDLLASGGNLSVKAGYIDNYEGNTIFSNGDMYLEAGDRIYNYKGEISSFGDIRLEATNLIRNYSGSIESGGDISINTDKLENIGEELGSYYRYWVNHYSNVYSLPCDEYWHKIGEEAVISDMRANKANILANGNITVKNGDGLTNLINRESNIITGGNITLFANVNNTVREETLDLQVHLGCHSGHYKQWWEKKKWWKCVFRSVWVDDYAEGWTTEKKIIKSSSPSLIKAGGTVKIEGERVGNGEYNQNANVNNVNINSYTIGTELASREILKESGKIEVNLDESSSIFKRSSGIKEVGELTKKEVVEVEEVKKGSTKGIFLADEVGELTKKEVVEVEEVKKGSTKGIFSADEVEGLTKKEVVEKEKEEINIEKREKPSYNYIMETRLDYIDMSKFYGSEYLLERIGFNPEGDISFLGDAYYETTIITNAIQEMTNQMYLNEDYTGKSEQLKWMLDNAAEVYEDLELSVGIALSKEQIEDLQEPIIWLVEKEVEGQLVYCPEIYLPDSYIKALEFDKSSTISGTNVVMELSGDLENSGSIKAKNYLSVTAANIYNTSILGEEADISGRYVSLFTEGDIENIGSRIFGEEGLSLKSEEGDIINKTEVYRTSYGGDSYIKDKLGSIASIASGGSLDIMSGRDFVNKGAEVKSEGDARIRTERETIFDVVNLRERLESGKNVSDKTEVSGSELVVGGSLVMKSKDEIKIIGSSVDVGEYAKLKTQGDLNILNAYNESYTYSEESKKSLFSSKTTSKTTHDLTVVGSEIKIGTKIKEEASEETTTVEMSLEEQAELIANKEAYAEYKESEDYEKSLANLTEELINNKKKGTAISEVSKEELLKLKEENIYTYSKLIQEANDQAEEALEFDFEYGSERGMNSAIDNLEKTGKSSMIAEGSVYQIGSKINSGSSLAIEAGEGIYELSISDEHFEESKTSKSSWFGLKKEKEEITTLNKKQISSVMDIVGDLDLKSKGDIQIIGSEVKVSENLDMEVGNDILIASAEESSYRKELKEKSGFGGIGVSFTNSSVSFDVKTKSKEEEEVKVETKQKSSMIDVGGNISSKSGNNTIIAASNVYGGGDVIMDADKALFVISKEEVEELNKKKKEMVKTLSFTMGNKWSETADNAVNNAKSGYETAQGDYSTTGGAISNGLKTGISVLNTANDVAGCAVTAPTLGFYAGVSLKVEGKEEKSKEISKVSKGSAIVSGANMSLKSGGELRVEGSYLKSGGDMLMEGEEINILAGKNTQESKSSSSSYQYELSMGTAGVSGSAGYNESEMNSSSTSYSNSVLKAGANYTAKADNMKVSGVNVEGEKVALTIAKELKVESLQDETEMESSNYGVNVGANKNKESSSGSMGFNVGKGETSSKWVNTQTSIVGKSSVIIRADKMINNGSLISNIDESGTDKGNLNISVNELIVKDIKDSYEENNSGIGINLVSSKSEGKEAKGNSSLNFSNSGQEKEQINRGTIGNGIIIVGGKEQANLDINRDVSKSQEVTKDKKTGGWDVNIDGRVLTEKGRAEIKEELNQGIDNVKNIGENTVRAGKNAKNGVEDIGESAIKTLSGGEGVKEIGIITDITNKGKMRQASMDFGRVDSKNAEILSNSDDYSTEEREAAVNAYNKYLFDEFSLEIR